MFCKIKDQLKSENGAVPVVEATFVFPVMFFVIFFLLFMGNMYVSKAYVDNAVNQAAIKYAAQCADPNLKEINEKKSLGGLKLKSEPYRYIFNAFGSSGSIGSAKSDCISEIKNKGGSFFSFFKGMQPEIKTVNVKFNNNVVSYSLSVSAEYSISLPWKFLFSDEIQIYNFKTHAEVPISDAPEFIRNVDMAIDYLQQSETVDKFTEKIKSIFNKKNIMNLDHK